MACGRPSSAIRSPTRFPCESDRAAARAELGIAADARVLAVLPGSRRGEVEQAARIFAGAAELLRRWFPARYGRAHGRRRPCANSSPRAARIRAHRERAVAGWPSGLALAAADAALVASGTATLQTVLMRPMVVAYRLRRSLRSWCAHSNS